MSEMMDESIKRWTARRKSALVMEILQGKTTVAEASRSYDLTPSEIEGWVEDAKKGMENALRTNPLDVRQQYEKQLKDLQEAYGEAMLELRARKDLYPQQLYTWHREFRQLWASTHEPVDNVTFLPAEVTASAPTTSALSDHTEVGVRTVELGLANCRILCVPVEIDADRLGGLVRVLEDA